VGSIPTIPEIERVLHERAQSILTYLQKQPEPGCTFKEAEVHLDTIARYAKTHPSKVFDSSDTDSVYNRLRIRAAAHKRLTDLFTTLNVKYEHEICHFLQEALPNEQEMKLLFKYTVEKAQSELVTLAPNTTNEELTAWTWDFVQREVLAHKLEVHWNKNIRYFLSKAFAYTHNQDAADDLLQETYHHALRYFKSSPKARFPEEGKFRAYCIRIMHNVYVDNAKKHSQVLSGPDIDEFLDHVEDEEDGYEHIDQIVGDKWLAELLKTLSLAEQALIQQHFVNDVSLQEIAQTTGKSLNTITARYKRLRPKIFAKLPATKLREHLDTYVDSSKQIDILINNFVPRGENPFDKVSTETKFVRSVLKLHVLGTSPPEIANLLVTNEQAVQRCLDDHLQELFKRFYSTKKA
jgi:RNA polymerase sigma factor (sigma-70 family)